MHIRVSRVFFSIFAVGEVSVCSLKRGSRMYFLVVGVDARVRLFGAERVREPGDYWLFHH